jgi:hypothetical protein
LYRDGKLYSKLLIVFEFIHALAYIFHTLFVFTYHHVKHPSFIACSNQRRGNDHWSEEENPTVEVGFDICGSSREPNTSPNQGKPWSIQTIPRIYKCFYNLSPIICALSDIRIGWSTNCCMPTLIFRCFSLLPFYSYRLEMLSPAQLLEVGWWFYHSSQYFLLSEPN